MKTLLNNFLKNKTDINELKKVFGSNLYNANIATPEIVYSKDVIFIIEQYVSGKMTLQQITDWVNVMWFSELFDYNDQEEESIASVISVLETLDEEGVHFSNDEFEKMMQCLSNNEVFL